MEELKQTLNVNGSTDGQESTTNTNCEIEQESENDMDVDESYTFEEISLRLQMVEQKSDKRVKEMAQSKQK